MHFTFATEIIVLQEIIHTKLSQSGKKKQKLNLLWKKKKVIEIMGYPFVWLSGQGAERENTILGFDYSIENDWGDKTLCYLFSDF